MRAILYLSYINGVQADFVCQGVHVLTCRLPDLYFRFVCVARKWSILHFLVAQIFDGGLKCYWGIGLGLERFLKNVLERFLKNALSDTNNAEQNHTLYQAYQELQGKRGTGIAQWYGVNNAEFCAIILNYLAQPNTDLLL